MYYPTLNLIFEGEALLSSSVSIHDSYEDDDVFELSPPDDEDSLESTIELFFTWLDVLLDQYADGYEHGIVEAEGEDEEDTDNEM